MSKFIKIYDCNSNQPVILNIEAIAKIQYEPGANNYRIALYSNGSDTHVDRKMLRLFSVTSELICNNIFRTFD